MQYLGISLNNQKSLETFSHAATAGFQSRTIGSGERLAVSSWAKLLPNLELKILTFFTINPCAIKGLHNAVIRYITNVKILVIMNIQRLSHIHLLYSDLRDRGSLIENVRKFYITVALSVSCAICLTSLSTHF